MSCTPKQPKENQSKQDQPASVAEIFETLLVVALWYVFSFMGVVFNKSILSPGDMRVEPRLLALVQTCSTVVFGFTSQLVLTPSRKTPVACRGRDAKALRYDVMVFLALGLLRFLCLFLGLVSLKNVAASFTETIKAASPMFTVMTAYLLLGERTPQAALLTLVPVMGGLVLTSAREVSFTLTGFLAAIATNATESVQNVFCQHLLRSGDGDESESTRYTPIQLQSSSSSAALIVQLILLAVGPPLETNMSPSTAAFLLLNGAVYALQSALVFQVMAKYSAVAVSVLNTSKRALIIICSAIYFGNVISPLAAAGTATTLYGGFLYSRTRAKGPSATTDHPSKADVEVEMPAKWLCTAATDVIRAYDKAVRAD